MNQIHVHVHTNDTEEKTTVKNVVIGASTEPRQGYTFSVTGDSSITATDPAGGSRKLTAADVAEHQDFSVGKDYYIFATMHGGDAAYIIADYKEFCWGNLVGGFHYGKCRRFSLDLQPVNADGEERGEGWESNVYDGILPFSLWTLTNRPRCDPAGMVQLPTGLWVDIYQASKCSNGGLASVYGAKPLTSNNWYKFSELAIVKGKRLLSYNEWCIMALGSPQGLDDSNANAWTAHSNNGPAKTGHVDNAVSVFGCRDAVGNVYEWLSDLTSDPDGGEWQFWDKMPGYGQLFMAGSTGLMALIAGGNWNSGVRAGARAVDTSYYPWNVGANIGARCACDSL